ncbi:MAG: hypothetical protein RL735_2236 [Pseudomonadota bacterium]
MSGFSLSLTPLVPSALLIVLALGAVLVVALGLLARRRGTLLRALGLALVLVALADPSLVREDREPLKDVVAVVLDRSASQSIRERRAQTDKARAEIEKNFAALGHVDLRFIDGGGVDSGNDGTRLFASLNAALADVPPERIGGAFLVTDGVVHDIPANVGALGFNAPLHVFITGREGERDRRIELVEAPRFGLVGKEISVGIRVHDTGGSNEPVAVRLRRDGVNVANLRLRPGLLVRVPVLIDHGGPNVLEFEAAALPEELTDINNKAVLTVEGVRDKLKVLLVSGEPHSGERTWRNLLKSDANVDLVHFTILRPPEKQDGTPISELSLIAFPTSDLFGRRIRDFDLIILDRYSNQTILPSVYFENMVRYVREGGALLIAAGPDFSGPDGLFYSPLGKISPARPSAIIERPFRAQISEDGRKHPVTRALPGSESSPPAWSEWYRQVAAERLRGTAILNGVDNQPLVLLSREEKGRVGLMLSDQIWLWARGFQGGGPHLDLMRRMAHWLMKEPELEEEALRATARGREITITRQTLKTQTAPVTLTGPNGASRQVSLAQGEPGLSQALVNVEDFGLYRISDGELSALVNVGPENPREFQNVVSTTERLRPLAEASGGTVRRISAGANDEIQIPRLVAMREALVYGGADYAAVKRTGSSIVTGIGVSSLAIGFIGLIALLGGIILGWIGESRRRKA